MNKNTKRIRNLVILAILSALIVGLQFIGGITIGPVSITLTLIPIVVGAILLGPALGTVLGLVFGLVVSLLSIFGRCGVFSQDVFAYSPALAWTLCLLKGAAAGFLPALVYRAVKQKTLAAYLASMTAPVVNTGIFIAGMLIFFIPVLEKYSGGKNLITFVFIGIAGLNFLVEFAIAVIFAPAVALVVKSVGKSYFE